MKTTYPMYMAVPKMSNFWDQHNLSVEEAAAYFRIGEHKLRDIIEANPHEKFILRNGRYILIKKNLFAQFIDNCSFI